MTSDLILEAFHRRLRNPADPLLVSQHGETTVGQVDQLARELAQRLLRHAVGPGVIVGLTAANGSAFVAALLAMRHAGGTALLLDSRTPEAERRRICDALGASSTLVCKVSWPQATEDFAIQQLPGPRPESRPRPESAVIKLTSGSSGMPRGILTSSAALIADDAALTTTMGLADDERILVAIPMSHSYGLSSIVMPALMRRALLIVPAEGNPLAPMTMARTHRATFFPTVPAYLQALVKMTHPPAAPSSLRRVISAGAPLKPDTASRFRAIYGQHVHVFYGASDCGGISFDRSGTAGERGTLGTPVDGVDIDFEPISTHRLDDSQPGNGCQHGCNNLNSDGDLHRANDKHRFADLTCRERGTVTVRSAAVADSYYPKPDPSLDNGAFRTHDIATLCDGELLLEGRLDDLINIRGKYVDPREVDAVLAQLAGVEETVTLGIARPGKDEPIVRSVIACPTGSLSHETVLRWCRRHLVSYKVPRSLVFLERIPRTARGKIDRAALLGLAPGSGASAEMTPRNG